MWRAYVTCKECKKQFESMSRIETIAKVKRNIVLWNHYRKEHNMDIFRLIIKGKIKKHIDNKFRK
ncbi:hypothetical protein [Clostridium beijerinckii]|uniref:hypothetical protein n=1 Tax=Clostridium beijerinckii TaxID=1520 RepID=UPI00047A179F|nr:hypothetical protein [Clostridium beijerinckii]